MYEHQGRKRGRNREIGINNICANETMYKIDKNLLHSTRNSTQKFFDDLNKKEI